MAERPRVCIDRVLPQAQFQPLRTMMIGDRQRAVIFFQKLWINGSTLRVRFLGGTPAQQALAREQALWWVNQAQANIRFEFNNAPDAEIRIAFDPNDGAWSYIGTDCKGIPQNEPTMNLGFLDGGTAAHEFGHALGLGHEHQNPAGGIQWNREVVLRDLSGPPNNWTPEQIEHNVLTKYSVDHIRGTTFDPKSVMLYFFPASWTLNGQGTSANEVLSETDKAFIASAVAYPRTNTPEPVPLPVIDRSGTQAEIGEPGEEDVFTFTVAKTGQHTIETGGQTDVVMKLFGPNSRTNLIAEDDDGGQGRNSRIVRDLSVGTYYVQVRHYNTTNGTGAYTISVTR
jgi:hypothetical protein